MKRVLLFGAVGMVLAFVLITGPVRTDGAGIAPAGDLPVVSIMAVDGRYFFEHLDLPRMYYIADLWGSLGAYLYFMQIGFMARTSRGRIATDLAYRHLGVEPPEGQARLL